MLTTNYARLGHRAGEAVPEDVGRVEGCLAARGIGIGIGGGGSSALVGGVQRRGAGGVRPALVLKRGGHGCCELGLGTRILPDSVRAIVPVHRAPSLALALAALVRMCRGQGLVRVRVRVRDRVRVRVRARVSAAAKASA